MGIFISRETLKNMGLEKFEVKILYAELKIRPLSCTKRMFGFFKVDEKFVEEAIEEYEREKGRRK